jgi:hypothetical protein
LKRTELNIAPVALNIGKKLQMRKVVLHHPDKVRQKHKKCDATGGKDPSVPHELAFSRKCQTGNDGYNQRSAE